MNLIYGASCIEVSIDDDTKVAALSNRQDSIIVTLETRCKVIEWPCSVTARCLTGNLPGELILVYFENLITDQANLPEFMKAASGV